MLDITGTNVTIMVKNMDQAIDFYLKIGLSLQQRWDNHYAMVTAPGLTLGIHPSEGTELNSGSVSIGFMVKNLAEAKALLESQQIACTGQDDGKSGLYLHFKDPDGTTLYFVEPKWE